MMARLEKALWIGLGSGLLDAAFGLTSLGLSLGHLAGVLVVVALHQLIAVTLAALVWLMAPEPVTGWRPGGVMCVTAPRAVTVSSARRWLGWSGRSLCPLDGRSARPFPRRCRGACDGALRAYFAGAWGRGSADAHGGVAWRIAFGLRRLPQRGPLARVHGFWVSPQPLVVWLTQRSGSGETCSSRRSHLRSAWCLASPYWGLCSLSGRRRRSGVRASLVVAAAALLVVGWVGDWTSAAPMLRRGAPGSGVVVRALDRLTDWDGDGVASHFGAKDCAPFDRVSSLARSIFPTTVWTRTVTEVTSRARTSRWTARTTCRRSGGLRRPKKIVLVSIDALRPDHLGAYGYTPTPPRRT